MRTYRINDETGQIEIFFDGIPDYHTRESMKQKGFRWNPNRQCWWNKYSRESEQFAKKICRASFPNETIVANNKDTARVAHNGSCGQTARWVLQNTGTLIISGHGSIKGHSFEEQAKNPWSKIKDTVTEVVVEGAIDRIGKRAFCNFSNLKTVIIKSNVKVIEERAFARCRQLQKMLLPVGLKTIERYAFLDCTAVPEIHIPASATGIDADAFKGWTSNQKIYLEEETPFPDFTVEQEYTPEEFRAMCRHDICFEDFVTISNNKWCVDQGHEIEDIQASIYIVRPNGTVAEMVIPAGYCKICDRYHLTKWQYEDLKKQGVILCQIVNEEIQSTAKGSGYFNQLSPESILKQSGYTVSSVENLTDKQRQQVLSYLMESQLCSRYRIINHLTWLIQSREGQMYLQNAVGKWKSDREFVERYKLGSKRLVGVRSLKTK